MSRAATDMGDAAAKRTRFLRQSLRRRPKLLPPFLGTRRFSKRRTLRNTEQLLRVAIADLLALGVGKRDRIEDLQRIADIARALFLIEGAIRREDDMIGAEEIDAADGRGTRTFHRGVAVIILEIVE